MCSIEMNQLTRPEIKIKKTLLPTDYTVKYKKICTQVYIVYGRYILNKPL